MGLTKMKHILCSVRKINLKKALLGKCLNLFFMFLHMIMEIVYLTFRNNAGRQ